jgi:hypothetical protein
MNGFPPVTAMVMPTSARQRIRQHDVGSREFSRLARPFIGTCLPKFFAESSSNRRQYFAAMDCLIYLREDCSYRAVRLTTTPCRRASQYRPYHRDELAVFVALCSGALAKPSQQQILQ